MCILFGHESWVNCTRFQKICPLSLLSQTSHTVLWWQGTFCSVCGRSLLQDGAMCREVGRMACHRCLVGKHDKVMSCFDFFCILRESNRLFRACCWSDVQNHKEISEIQSDSQPVLSQLILTWPGWVTFSVPFRREMISKKTSGTATRDLGFVVTTSTRHRWQVLLSVEWLSDTFSKACRPVFP